MTVPLFRWLDVLPHDHPVCVHTWTLVPTRSRFRCGACGSELSLDDLFGPHEGDPNPPVPPPCAS